MINIDYLQMEKPELARNVGHTTDGVMSALQLMELHGAVFYLISRMNESDSVRSIIKEFSDFWSVNFYQIRPNEFLVNDKIFKVVCLDNYERATEGLDYPIVIDHWAEFVGVCQYCNEITGNCLNRVCHNCGNEHNPVVENEVWDYSPNDEIELINSILHVALHNWKDEGF